MYTDNSIANLQFVLHAVRNYGVTTLQKVNFILHPTVAQHKLIIFTTCEAICEICENLHLMKITCYTVLILSLAITCIYVRMYFTKIYSSFVVHITQLRSYNT